MIIVVERELSIQINLNEPIGKINSMSGYFSKNLEII